MNWTAAEPVPTEFVDRLPQALAIAEQSLAKAGPKMWGVAIGRLLNWIEQFGIVALPASQEAREDWKTNITASYHAALSDLPADLLVGAVDKVIATHTFRNLPLPGDVRAKVELELGERRALAAKIKAANFLAQKQGHQAARAARKPHSEADKAAVIAAAAQAKAILDNATIKRVPTQAGDRRAPVADPYRAAYAALKRTGDE